MSGIDRDEVADFPTQILNAKKAVYDYSGTEPDTIDLPLNLYYELIRILSKDLVGELKRIQSLQ